jgi:hypothetical protein
LIFDFCNDRFLSGGGADKMAILYLYKEEGFAKVEENNLFLKNIGFYFAV